MPPQKAQSNLVHIVQDYKTQEASETFLLLSFVQARSPAVVGATEVLLYNVCGGGGGRGERRKQTRHAAAPDDRHHTML